jgi:hypothetical protein
VLGVEDKGLLNCLVELWDNRLVEGRDDRPVEAWDDLLPGLVVGVRNDRNPVKMRSLCLVQQPRGRLRLSVVSPFCLAALRPSWTRLSGSARSRLDLCTSVLKSALGYYHASYRPFSHQAGHTNISTASTCISLCMLEGTSMLGVDSRSELDRHLNGKHVNLLLTLVSISTVGCLTTLGARSNL